MKSLLIVRHAKSSWDSVIQKDFDRTLNERGHRDAPAMAERLKNKKVSIDAFVSSPATRALTTATYFAKAYGVNAESIIQIPELYHAPVKVFNEVIQQLDDRFDAIALFSHNPGITEFVNRLTDIKIDNMPTCAVFAVKADVNSWSDFNGAVKTFWFFDYPKNV